MKNGEWNGTRTLRGKLGRFPYAGTTKDSNGQDDVIEALRWAAFTGTPVCYP